MPAWRLRRIEPATGVDHPIGNLLAEAFTEPPDHSANRLDRDMRVSRVTDTVNPTPLPPQGSRRVGKTHACSGRVRSAMRPKFWNGSAPRSKQSDFPTRFGTTSHFSASRKRVGRASKWGGQPLTADCGAVCLSRQPNEVEIEIGEAPTLRTKTADPRSSASRSCDGGFGGERRFARQLSGGWRKP
jgi:hypothetical protein